MKLNIIDLWRRKKNELTLSDSLTYASIVATAIRYWIEQGVTDRMALRVKIKRAAPNSYNPAVVDEVIKKQLGYYEA